MNLIALKIGSITDKVMPVPREIYRSFNVWWLFTGCLSLYGFVFLKLPAISASGFFHALMILAFFVSVVKAPRDAKRDPAWYLIVAAIAISLFIYFWSNYYFPEYAESHPSTGKLLALCQFLPIAWWLGGQVRNVLWLLSAALAGLFVWLFMHGIWSGFAAGIAGERVDFDMRNAQHTAMFFSVALMGWLLFIKRIIGNGYGYKKTLRIAIWLSGTVVLSTGFIITQTRTAWISVTAALLFVAIVVLLYGRFSFRQIIVGSVAATVILIALIYPMSDMINTRLNKENNTIQKILESGGKNVPLTSIGKRVVMWMEAWKWIKQRPITGWGSEVRRRVFTESKTLPKKISRRFGHFHNSYIEILLSYGLIGLFFVISIFYVIVRQTWLGWRSGKIPPDVFLFGLAFLIFWILANITESYLIGRTGVYLTGLIGGCMYTFSLSERLKLSTSDRRVV